MWRPDHRSARATRHQASPGHRAYIRRADVSPTQRALGRQAGGGAQNRSAPPPCSLGLQRLPSKKEGKQSGLVGRACVDRLRPRWCSNKPQPSDPLQAAVHCPVCHARYTFLIQLTRVKQANLNTILRELTRG